MDPVKTPTAPAVAQLDHHGTPSHEVYTAGFYVAGSGTCGVASSGSDSFGWDHVVRSLLGKACRGGADAGEVLATVASVEHGDHEGWRAGWARLGARLVAVGADCAVRGHRVSAARAYLRAANYLAVAVDAVDGQDDELRTTFRAHQAAWDGFAATTGWPVERVDIPYEGSSMPGWLFHPDASDRPRPVLVVDNGTDGSLSGGWCDGGEGGLERGYTVLLYDGPGHGSMLIERNVPFRHDWEKALTPVVDFLVARDDVDPGRLAVSGRSQAGYSVPRALAFEHRFAAAIADGGAVDLSRPWFALLPPALSAVYQRGAHDEFDRAMATMRRTWRSRARPYGVSGYAAVLDAVSRCRLHHLTDLITTPLLVADPDGEQFFAGQSAELAALVPGATLARFTQGEGASHHCQPMARELTEQRTFDWLDEQLR